MIRRSLLALVSAASAFAQVGPFVVIPPGRLGDTEFAAGFRMQRTEVTVEAFEAFLRATRYITEAEKAGASGTWRAPGFRVTARQPVVYVTPRDAAAYCEHIGARLPTDAEWEYAARAGAPTRHFWGDSLDARYLWYRGNSGGRPRNVATRLPNAWGLYDMEGNVWEWTVLPDQSGAAMARRRGGSWVDCEDIAVPSRQLVPLIGLLVGFGIPVQAGHRYDDIGFRCAR